MMPLRKGEFACIVGMNNPQQIFRFLNSIIHAVNKEVCGVIGCPNIHEWSLQGIEHLSS